MDPRPSELGYPFWSKKQKINCWVSLMSSLERFYILQMWHIIVKEYWFCHTIILYQGANANKTVLCCTIIIYVKTCCSISWKVLKQSMHIKINTKKFSWDKYRKKFIFIFNSETLERAFKNKIGFVSRSKVWWICIKENQQPDEKWHLYLQHLLDFDLP